MIVCTGGEEEGTKYTLLESNALPDHLSDTFDFIYSFDCLPHWSVLAVYRPYTGRILAVYWPKPRLAAPALRRGGMNTFSKNGNDFVGRLLHEGGVSRRTFSGFPQYPNGQYGCTATLCSKNTTK